MSGKGQTRVLWPVLWHLHIYTSAVAMLSGWTHQSLMAINIMSDIDIALEGCCEAVSELIMKARCDHEVWKVCPWRIFQNLREGRKEADIC